MPFSCFICTLTGLQVKYSVWGKKKINLYLGDDSAEIPAAMPSRRRRLHLVERFRDLHQNSENITRNVGLVKWLCGGSLLNAHGCICGMKVRLQVKSVFMFYKVISNAAVLPPDWISPASLTDLKKNNNSFQCFFSPLLLYERST